MVLRSTQSNQKQLRFTLLRSSQAVRNVVQVLPRLLPRAPQSSSKQLQAQLHLQPDQINSSQLSRLPPTGNEAKTAKKVTFSYRSLRTTRPLAYGDRYGRLGGVLSRSHGATSPRPEPAPPGHVAAGLHLHPDPCARSQALEAAGQPQDSCAEGAGGAHGAKAAF